MSAILQLLWPVLAVSTLLGFGFGAVFGGGAGLPSATVPVRITAFVAGCGLAVVAWTGIVPGRPGLWLDIAVACMVCYAAGAILAAGLRWAMARSRQGRRDDASLPST